MDKRPGWITFFAVLHFILALLSLLAILGSIIDGELLRAVVFAGLHIAIGYGLFAIGYGLWNLKNWARILVIIECVPVLFFFPIGTFISGAIIYYLARKKTKGFFIKKHEGEKQNIPIEYWPLLNLIKEYKGRNPWGSLFQKLKEILSFDLFKLFKKGKKICKSERTFVFPEEALIYERNGFRVLGLDTTNNLTSIVKRRDDAIKHINVELPLPYPLVSWPGCDSNIKMDDINHAYSRLQDTLKRVEEELFWFHLNGDEDKWAFEQIKGEDFQKAKDVWSKRVGTSPVQTSSGGRALHNLVVLEHALVISKEKSLNNPKPTNVLKDDWQMVFNLWKELCERDKCWDYFEQRIVYLNDPRITKRYISQFRKKVPMLVLRVNLEIARAALAQEMFEYAKQHLDLIKSSGFGSDYINTIMEEFFSKHKKELKKIRKGLEASPDEEHKGVVEKVNEIKNIVERIGGEKSIEKEINNLKPLLVSKTCYFCKICYFCNVRTADPKHTLEVKMYKVTGRDYTKIYYQTITINIPRCTKHKYSSSYGNHPTVKQHSDEGWSFGEEPDVWDLEINRLFAHYGANK